MGSTLSSELLNRNLPFIPPSTKKGGRSADEEKLLPSVSPPPPPPVVQHVENGGRELEEGVLQQQQQQGEEDYIPDEEEEDQEFMEEEEEEEEVAMAFFKEIRQFQEGVLILLRHRGLPSIVARADTAFARFARTMIYTRRMQEQLLFEAGDDFMQLVQERYKMIDKEGWEQMCDHVSPDHMRTSETASNASSSYEKGSDLDGSVRGGVENGPNYYTPGLRNRSSAHQPMMMNLVDVTDESQGRHNVQQELVPNGKKASEVWIETHMLILLPMYAMFQALTEGDTMMCSGSMMHAIRNGNLIEAQRYADAYQRRFKDHIGNRMKTMRLANLTRQMCTLMGEMETEREGISALRQEIMDLQKEIAQTDAEFHQQVLENVAKTRGT